MQDQQSVFNQLKAFILENQFCAGDRLPSERRLAAVLSTSRTTVRRVLLDMNERELVSRNRQGRTLVSQKLLDTILKQPSASRKENESNVISAMVIRAHGSAMQLWLQNYLLNKKIILNLYHSLKGGAQLPATEAGYLRSLLATRPKALLAHLTPLMPTNEKLLLDLENAGTRIIHIGWYSTELPDQAFFLIDFEYAGQMAVMHLAEKNCRKISVVGMGETAPYACLFRRGIENAASMLGIELIDTDLPWTGPAFESRELCANFKKLDSATGLIINNSESITGICHVCQELFDGGIPFPVIGVGNYDPDGDEATLIPYLGVSWKERVRSAIAFALGEPDAKAHRLFRPTLIMPSGKK